MNEQVVDKITGYLDKIAAKLGVTVEQIWPWLVRQQYVEALWYGFLAAVFIGAAFITIKFTTLHWDPDNSGGKKTYSIFRSDHEGSWLTLCIVLGLFAVVFFGFFAFEFLDIFNPQYAALKELLEIAR